jgi:hypothetical protein
MSEQQTPTPPDYPPDVKPTVHRDPAPTPAEHNRAFAERPDCAQHSPAGFDSAGQGGR